jgi:hypothetical protein
VRNEYRIPLFEQDLDFLEQRVALSGRQTARRGRVQRLTAYLIDEFRWNCGCFTHKDCCQLAMDVY